ncbi:MAG: hypothetical protein WA126_04970, partial [Thermodesulfovibrionales bacterium]
MKRKELIKRITSAGCLLIRHGHCHDLYINHKTGKKQPVPRHSEEPCGRDRRASKSKFKQPKLLNIFFSPLTSYVFLNYFFTPF